MKSTLGWLGWLTLAFVGGLLALPLVWRCNDGATSLPCTLEFGMLFLAAIIGAGLTAMILGIIACRAARQHQRWVWFAIFLLLTAMTAIGTVTTFLGAFGVMRPTLPVSLRVLPLVAPPLALVTAVFVFRGNEVRQTLPASPRE